MSFYGWDSPDIVYLYSASGKKLQKVSREMQVCEFVWKHPELVFDEAANVSGQASRKIEKETYKFGKPVKRSRG